MDVQYPFARDEEGRLIDILTIDIEHRYDHTYSCPECGQEMRPRLGKKQAHCFYHFHGEACESESYVHRVGKELLYKRFYDPKRPFLIEFNQGVRCDQWNTCQYRDNNSTVCDTLRRPKVLDLKDWYDTAEIEKELVVKGVGSFRADVMLYSKANSKRTPFFLEVCYKHPGSEEKKASGIKILELKVNDVRELSTILTADCFKAAEPLSAKSFPVVFYNLKEATVARQEILTELVRDVSYIPCTKEYQLHHSTLLRETFFPSGKSFRRIILPDEPHDFRAWFEVTYDFSRLPKRFDARELIAKHESDFRDCEMCSSCFSNDLDNTWCLVNGSKRKGTFNPDKAKTCPKFCPRGESREPFYFDPPVDYNALTQGEDYQVWVNPRAKGRFLSFFLLSN